MLIVIIVLLSSAITSIFIYPKQALALTSTNSAVKAGGGIDLWDNSTNSFNSYVVADLAKKLFGNENPIKYTKSMKDSFTDCYVVPASTINSKVGNPDNGMVVQLGGKQWMVTSLTIADKDGKENIDPTPPFWLAMAIILPKPITFSLILTFLLSSRARSPPAA